MTDLLHLCDKHYRGGSLITPRAIHLVVMPVRLVANRAVADSGSNNLPSHGSIAALDTRQYKIARSSQPPRACLQRQSLRL